MYDEDDFLLLSGVQHFVFCRRQWALIHVEQQWNENILTAKGRDEHQRVHDNRITDVRNGKITRRGMKVHSRRLGVSGECDAVEFLPVENGISLRGRSGEWAVVPVEYKHGTVKSNDCDRLQVATQAMCLEEMFSCKIEKAYIFYFKSRHREEVLITQDIRTRVENTFKEMHSYMSREYTPKVKSSKACKQCSLKDLCLPELQGKQQTVDDYVSGFIGGKP